jgi:metal-responsive CopG/Arc/MetJ family transcriptional regulator
MRIHVVLDDDLVESMDERVGPRGRSAFIADAVRRALHDEQRWDALESAFGSIADTGHDWDDDSALWVHEQRRIDPRRVG